MHRIWVSSDDHSLKISPEQDAGVEIELLARRLSSGIDLVVSQHAPPVVNFWQRLRRGWYAFRERYPCLTTTHTELSYVELKALVNWVRRHQEEPAESASRQLTMGMTGAPPATPPRAAQAQAALS